MPHVTFNNARMFNKVFNVAIVMHCNLRPLDVAPVFLDFNYGTHYA